MRIRTIKPEWLDDDRLAYTSPEARVLTVSLILLADDYGNGRADRYRLVSRIFPAAFQENSRESRDRAFSAIEELCEIGFMELYRVRGQEYYSIRNWSKHQRVDKPGKPKVPGPSESDAKALAKPPDTLAKIPGSLAPDQDQDQDQDQDHIPGPSRNGFEAQFISDGECFEDRALGVWSEHTGLNTGTPQVRARWRDAVRELVDNAGQQRMDLPTIAQVEIVARWAATHWPERGIPENLDPARAFRPHNFWKWLGLAEATAKGQLRAANSNTRPQWDGDLSQIDDFGMGDDPGGVRGWLDESEASQ